MAIPYTTPAKAKEIAKESIKESGVSKVTVSSTGSATDTVQYITIDGVEKKLAGGGSGENPYADILFKDSDGTTLIEAGNEYAGLNIHSTVDTGSAISLAIADPDDVELNNLTRTLLTPNEINIKVNKGTIDSFVTLKAQEASGETSEELYLDLGITYDKGADQNPYSDVYITKDSIELNADQKDDEGNITSIYVDVETTGSNSGYKEVSFNFGDASGDTTTTYMAFNPEENNDYVGNIEINRVEDDNGFVNKHYVGYLVLDQTSPYVEICLPIDIRSSVPAGSAEFTGAQNKQILTNVLKGEYVTAQLIGRIVTGKLENVWQAFIVFSVEEEGITFKKLDQTGDPIVLTGANIVNGEILELTSGRYMNDWN